MAPEAKVTAATLRARKGTGERIAVLTAYDVVFARLCDGAGIDVVLVGDSLGMVVQGERSTLAVTLDEMVYHSRIVARGITRAHLVADMPFMSYQASIEDGMRSAGRLMKEGHAEAVKLEGGVEVAELCRRLVRRRDPGDGTRRADATINSPARRLQGPGAHRRAARPDPRRRARPQRRGRLRHRARGDSPRAGRRDHARRAGADHRHRRRRRLRRAGDGDARSPRGCSRAGSRASCAATPRWARPPARRSPPTPPTSAPARSRRPKRPTNNTYE